MPEWKEEWGDWEDDVLTSEIEEEMFLIGLQDPVEALKHALSKMKAKVFVDNVQLQEVFGTEEALNQVLQKKRYMTYVELIGVMEYFAIPPSALLVRYRLAGKPTVVRTNSTIGIIVKEGS